MNHFEEEWHSDLPHSFGGKYRSYEYYKHNTHQKDIDDEFKRNDIYSRFKQYKRAKHHNPVYVYKKREQFQADCIKFGDPLMLEATNQTTHLLVVIDIYTKYVWLYPLKQITGVNVASCLRHLFLKNKPEKITTDAGREFINKNVYSIFKEFKIKHYIAKGRTKACIVERFNLTLQRLIYQLCRFHNTNKWTSDEILGKAKKIYLNRKHRTIHMTPSQAEREENASTLRKIYKEKYKKASSETKGKKPKFKIGDQCRISSIRRPFERGYLQNFTTEVWTVCEVMNNLPLARYRVKDSQNEILDCILNENELVHYTPKNKYAIHKILKTRHLNGKKQFLVNWLHYDDKFNSWVNEEDLESV